MSRRPPSSTRTDTLFPYATPVRSKAARARGGRASCRSSSIWSKWASGSFIAATSLLLRDTGHVLDHVGVGGLDPVLLPVSLTHGQALGLADLQRKGGGAGVQDGAFLGHVLREGARHGARQHVGLFRRRLLAAVLLRERALGGVVGDAALPPQDRKSTRLNSSH